MTSKSEFCKTMAVRTSHRSMLMLGWAWAPPFRDSSKRAKGATREYGLSRVFLFLESLPTMAEAVPCHYAVLQVERDATNDELKRQYRKLALKWHPDKNQSQVQLATENFRRIQNAYDVLADQHERAWYDAHREAILRGGSGLASTSQEGSKDDQDFDLWAYFSASAYDGFNDDDKGFFHIFANVFSSIDRSERTYMDNKQLMGVETAPEFGQSTASWLHVQSFYSHWEAFTSVRTFASADLYDTRTAENRQERRAMEKENTRARTEAKKKACECVRELVAYVRKRDPRVAAHIAAQSEAREAKALAADAERRRRQAEYDARREADARARQAAWDDEENLEAVELDALLAEYDTDEGSPVAQDRGKRSKKKKKKSSLCTSSVFGTTKDSQSSECRQANGEKSANADESNDNQLHAIDIVNIEDEVDEDMTYDDWYCIACKKKFRNARQWENHERSKKHLEKVRQLRLQLEEEDSIDLENGDILDVGIDGTNDFTSQQCAGDEFDADGKDIAYDLEFVDKKMTELSASDSIDGCAANQGCSSGSEYEGFLNAAADAVSSPRGQSSLNDEKAEQNFSKVVEKECPTKDESELLAFEDKSSSGKSRKEKRRAKKLAAKQMVEKAHLQCAVCDLCFESRNQLFRHIKKEGHAALR